MGSVLKIKDSQGNWIDVPALVNEGEVIIDIGHEITRKNQILAYDKHGAPAQNIDDVYTGIFRFVEAESNAYVEQAMPCLLVQNKNVVKNKENSSVDYRVYQMLLMGNGRSQYREITNLSHYPVFTDYTIEPYDDLDEFGTYNQPLSARQGYVLNQNKADKSEVIKVSKNIEDLRYWAEEELVGVKSDLSRKESITNKVAAIDDNASNSSYPNVKAVKDYVANMIEECIQRIMNEASTIRTTALALYASEWQGSDGVYSQTVTLGNVTPYSKIDLQPTAEQLHIFHEKDIAFVTENDNGLITVYCIGQKPANDYIMQATITEVKVDE